MPYTERRKEQLAKEYDKAIDYIVRAKSSLWLSSPDPIDFVGENYNEYHTAREDNYKLIKELDNVLQKVMEKLKQLDLEP